VRDLQVNKIDGVNKVAFETAKRIALGMLKTKMREAIKDANEYLKGDN
jgi:hypothetical protein